MGLYNYDSLLINGLLWWFFFELINVFSLLKTGWDGLCFECEKMGHTIKQ